MKDAASLPQFLLGGEMILFTKLRSYDPGGRRIEAVSLKTRARKVVLEDAEDARVVPTGHLVFARDGKMLAAPFDAGRLQVTAAPIVVLDDVMQAQNGTHTGVLTGAMHVAISPLGQLAWLGGGIAPDREGRIAWVDRRGRETPIAGSGPYFMVALSPDETHAAVYAFGRSPRVVIVDLARQSTQSISATRAPFILWSPDGKRVLHSGKVGDSSSLVLTLADGSRPAEPLAKGVLASGAPAFWSLDGRELFVVDSNYQLNGIKVTTGAKRVVTHLPNGMWWPARSPDGKWIAYSTREANGDTPEVFVQPWPTLDRRWKISTAGGIEPVWTRAGREIVYLQPGRSPDSTHVMSVEIGADPEFSAGIPHEIFSGPFGGKNPLRSWDVTANGSRFLVVRNTMVRSPPGDVHMMVNWFADLRRLFARAGSGS